MLNDPITNMLFLYKKVTFFTVNIIKYLPISNVAIKYFNPF